MSVCAYVCERDREREREKVGGREGCGVERERAAENKNWIMNWRSSDSTLCVPLSS